MADHSSAMRSAQRRIRRAFSRAVEERGYRSLGNNEYSISLNDGLTHIYWLYKHRISSYQTLDYRIQSALVHKFYQEVMFGSGKPPAGIFGIVRLSLRFEGQCFIRVDYLNEQAIDRFARGMNEVIMDDPLANVKSIQDLYQYLVDYDARDLCVTVPANEAYARLNVGLLSIAMGDVDEANKWRNRALLVSTDVQREAVESVFSRAMVMGGV